MRTGLALGLFAFATACVAERAEPPLAQLDLRAAMQTTADIKPVGLAIAPDGKRFVFDETSGLYRLDGELAVPVVPMSAMPDPGPTAAVKLPFTDLVAVAPNVFAITAIGDGYLLDTAAMTLTQLFCYVPDDGSPSWQVQRTDAVAYDAERGRLYAQPITYDTEGVFQWSEVAGYDRVTGDTVEWHTTTNDVAATAMVSIPGAGLFIGQGSRLARFDLVKNVAVPVDDLSRFGVRSIDGLAIDQAAGTLVVVDQQADAVFDIARSVLGL